jgi:DNA-directed RNA polymerase specialized sigma24 family protein
MVRRRGFSEDDAHNILNTCGAAVFTRLVDPEKPVLRNLLEYFNRMVQNQIAQYWRDREREPADLVRDEILEALPDDRPSTPPEAAAPLSPKRKAQLVAALTALDELPEYLRKPYELEIYGGLKPVEIARILRLRPATVRVYLSIARATVKKRVAELLHSGADGEEEDDE